MNNPTSEEIERFLEIVNKAFGFEAETFLIRGYGAFNRQTMPMPDPACVKVISWLENLTKYNYDI